MMRKNFAAVGLLFGIFLYAAIAFPGGMTQSLSDGTAHVPTVESVGGWGALLAFLFGVAAILLTLCICAAVFVFVMRRAILRDIARLYDVDLREIEHMDAEAAEQYASSNHKERTGG